MQLVQIVCIVIKPLLKSLKYALCTSCSQNLVCQKEEMLVIFHLDPLKSTKASQVHKENIRITNVPKPAGGGRQTSKHISDDGP